MKLELQLLSIFKFVYIYIYIYIALYNVCVFFCDSVALVYFLIFLIFVCCDCKCTENQIKFIKKKKTKKHAGVIDAYLANEIRPGRVVDPFDSLL